MAVEWMADRRMAVGWMAVEWMAVVWMAVEWMAVQRMGYGEMTVGRMTVADTVVELGVAAALPLAGRGLLVQWMPGASAAVNQWLSRAVLW
jgi:hypothetical protein